MAGLKLDPSVAAMLGKAKQAAAEKGIGVKPAEAAKAAMPPEPIAKPAAKAPVEPPPIEVRPEDIEGEISDLFGASGASAQPPALPVPAAKAPLSKADRKKLIDEIDTRHREIRGEDARTRTVIREIRKVATPDAIAYADKLDRVLDTKMKEANEYRYSTSKKSPDHELEAAAQALLEIVAEVKYIRQTTEQDLKAIRSSGPAAAAAVAATGVPAPEPVALGAPGKEKKSRAGLVITLTVLGLGIAGGVVDYFTGYLGNWAKPGVTFVSGKAQDGYDRLQDGYARLFGKEADMGAQEEVAPLVPAPRAPEAPLVTAAKPQPAERAQGELLYSPGIVAPAQSLPEPAVAAPPKEVVPVPAPIVTAPVVAQPKKAPATEPRIEPIVRQPAAPAPAVVATVPCKAITTAMKDALEDARPDLEFYPDDVPDAVVRIEITARCDTKGKVRVLGSALDAKRNVVGTKSLPGVAKELQSAVDTVLGGRAPEAECRATGKVGR